MAVAARRGPASRPDDHPRGAAGMKSSSPPDRLQGCQSVALPPGCLQASKESSAVPAATLRHARASRRSASRTAVARRSQCNAAALPSDEPLFGLAATTIARRTRRQRVSRSEPSTARQADNFFHRARTHAHASRRRSAPRHARRRSRGGREPRHYGAEVATTTPRWRGCSRCRREGCSLDLSQTTPTLSKRYSV